MPSDVFVITLLRAQVALSLGLLVAILLRGPLRRLIGPVLAYRLWAIGPAAALTSLFPTLAEFIRYDLHLTAFGLLATTSDAITHGGFWTAQADVLVWVWLAGAAALGLAFLAGELRFRRQARLGLAGPAVVGVAAPRLVVPFDFTTRFSAQERSFIRRHERAHIQRQDTLANLIIAVVQTLSWFNPVVHLAAAQAHLDQELACDAEVVDGRPSDRRPYAEALIKAQLSHRPLRLGCAWASARPHPLEMRLLSLRRKEPGLRRHVAGAVGVVMLAVALSTAVWSLAPRNGLGVIAADVVDSLRPR